MSARSHQVLLSTLRGNTAVAEISSSSSADVVWKTLWEAARSRDDDDKKNEEDSNNNKKKNYQQQDGRKGKRSLGDCSVGRTKKPRLGECPPPVVQVWYQGKHIKPGMIRQLLQEGFSSSALSDHHHHHLQQQYPLCLSLKIPILGGIDRQNRVGSKFGGGGVSSSQQSERERKERLKQLALESIDLAKDPYLMRNHLGTYECKLCLTLHPNEANYLAHTQGKKHQQALARRAHMEKLRAEREGTALPVGPTTATKTDISSSNTRKVKIGRPAYQVFKSRDADTNQRCLSFELSYPEIDVELIQPRHRFMSAFEQKIESPPDRRYQYLLFAADPYETVAFKIPNEPLDKDDGRFVTHWNIEEKKFTLTLYFMEPDTNKTN